ncbi:hypothetical protein GGS20DRAFT_593485 [Poronia punctata]|nr:hypothetical protein GGS20DRAFT_593485 [Poronia punctata]
MSNFYEQKTLRLFEKFEVPECVINFFKLYDDVRTSAMDEGRFANLIRVSPNTCEAIVNTMVKCAEMLNNSKANQTQSKHGLMIIKTCREILNLPHRVYRDVGVFPLMKLPLETRREIYDYYFGNVQDNGKVINLRKASICACAPHELSVYTQQYRRIPMNLALASRAVFQELLAYFFQRRTIFFSCPCDMSRRLATNPILHANLSSISIHWCGNVSDKAFLQLKQLPHLENLDIVISKTSTLILSARERQIRAFFAPRRGLLTLPESLGFEQLISLRGLREVTVSHSCKSKAERRTDAEKAALQALLRSLVYKEEEEEEE